MRYPKCPCCAKGVLHVKQTITIDDVTYRKKVCNCCGHTAYTESRQITREEWREKATYYSKRKSIEREAARECKQRNT